MACIHCLIEGKVQGVFFRASTQQQASLLRLSGWVKNRHDGRVELIACGEQETIQKLEAWLWQGPQYAQVTNVICETIEGVDSNSMSGFIIS